MGVFGHSPFDVIVVVVAVSYNNIMEPITKIGTFDQFNIQAIS